MNFKLLCNLIKTLSETCEFKIANAELEKAIFNIKKEQLVNLVKEIGIIPESIAHDSREEKLYAKVSDIILSRCFYELNMNVTVIKERANNDYSVLVCPYFQYPQNKSQIYG